MLPVLLPGEHSLEMATLAYEQLTDGPFPVLRFRIDTPGEATRLYSYDYRQALVSAYCLGDVINHEYVVSGGLSLSSDGRFLSMTVARVIDGEFPTFEDWGSVVVDTLTGHYARLMGLGTIGWAVASGEGN